ncbi:hypothetical protein KFE25_007734 [Diacronema lutheri]|uniref:rRNA adenine N(6)-methyltransferase n=2 Tax=Diacronema lutheri TaxID=2081491 RepID=A0A8J5XUH1_DIALT|nr:hypothetical protein KFE25_007734 [Diacronema lutheri]
MAASAGGKYPFLAKQSLGQNFLVDDGLARRIVASVADGGSGGSALVELGPGQGALTRHAFERWPRMTAVELDKRAIGALAETLPALAVVQGDMLRVDWAELARRAEGAERLSVMSNPPYHLTAELLLMLVLNAQHVGSAVLTLQKEAVERLLSPAGCKQYTPLGVLYALFARTEVLFELPPTAFSPAPKVTSTCIRIEFGSAERPVEPRLPPASARGVHRVARAAFSERRKMLRQSLKTLLAGLPPSADGCMLSVPERFAQLRAEQLQPADFAELSELLGFIRREPFST